MFKSSQDETIFEIPVELVPDNSFLYKLITKSTDLHVNITEEGIVLVDTPVQELIMMVNYILRGEIGHDPYKLVAILDYFGVCHIRAEYPEEYLRIKLQEEWYRRYLYNIEMIKLNPGIRNSEYNLIELTEDLIKTFDLVHNLHYLYARRIHIIQCKIQVDDHIVNMITKLRIKVEKPKSDAEKYYLLHTYPRPYVIDYTNNYEKTIKEVNEKFLQRDAKFGNSIIRESVRTRRQGKHVTLAKDENRYDFIGPDWQLSYPEILGGLNKSHIVSHLTKHNYWNNILLAGGSVANAIIGCNIVTDYDLFIYGVTSDQANNLLVKLIQSFEGVISVARSENAITIVIKSGRYQFTTVQIILRLYVTKSEIIHSFDVDACCVGYDGSHILLTPRALYSIQNMINIVDFDRMSPSYEFRLSKYMKRGFSVYTPELNPNNINIGQIQNYYEQKEARRQVSRKYYYIFLADNPQPNYDPANPAIYQAAYAEWNKNYDQALNNYIKTLPKISPLTGIDILLYNSYFPIGEGIINSKSDYNNKVGNCSTYCKLRTTTDSITINSSNNYDKMISYRINFHNSKIPVNIITSLILDLNTENYIVESLDSKSILSFPAQLAWKTINPGEQATSTFHSLVLTDPNLWYYNQFYTKE